MPGEQSQQVELNVGSGCQKKSRGWRPSEADRHLADCFLSHSASTAMMTLKSICAATGGAWAEVFPSTVFLLPAVWAGGLSGKRDTGAG